jgi:hypothetical protein
MAHCTSPGWQMNWRNDNWRGKTEILVENSAPVSLCESRLDHTSDLRGAQIFFFQWLFQPIQGPGLLIQFRNNFSQTVGLLGRAISSSQGLYPHTEQHKQNKRIHTPNIHALRGIRTHDFSVRANEDSSSLRPRGYCDRRRFSSQGNNTSSTRGLPLYGTRKFVTVLKRVLFPGI